LASGGLCRGAIAHPVCGLGLRITPKNVDVHGINRAKCSSVRMKCLLCVSDASVITEMRMADLMEMKTYTKLIAKQSKQLEALRRKHEKVCNVVI